MQATPRRQFHYRLAAHLQRVDVDDLVDSLTPGQLLEWEAMAHIDGWHHGWQQTAEILAWINNAANRVAASNGADVENMKFLSGSDVLRGFKKPFKRKSKKKHAPTMQTPMQRLAMLEAQYYGHNNDS